jgi:hyperosmotically inducible protein
LVGMHPAVYAASDSTSSVGAVVSDSALTAKVKSRLASDNRLQGSDVNVETNHGVVTLTGSARNSSAKDAAEDLARDVPGVRSVSDQIAAPPMTSEAATKAKQVARRTAEAVNDTAITTKLKAKYGMDSEAKGTDVDVMTIHRVVALSGTVPSEAKKTHLIDLAKQTSGVKQVDATALTVSAR